MKCEILNNNLSIILDCEISLTREVYDADHLFMINVFVIADLEYDVYLCFIFLTDHHSKSAIVVLQEPYEL